MEGWAPIWKFIELEVVELWLEVFKSWIIRYEIWFMATWFELNKPRVIATLVKVAPIVEVVNFDMYRTNKWLMNNFFNSVRCKNNTSNQITYRKFIRKAI